jgi:hypothetical protein
MVARASFGDYVWATIKNSGFKPKTLSIAEIKPIQTAEQKLRDKFIHFYQKGINDELCIDDAADELLSEFTITLKG